MIEDKFAEEEEDSNEDDKKDEGSQGDNNAINTEEIDVVEKKEAEKEKELTPQRFVVQKRSELLSQVLLLWACQIMLVFFIFNEVTSSDESYKNLVAYPDNLLVVASRFICGIVLHMSLQGELFQGMSCMKYALNHYYKFDDYKLAFLCGLCQCSMVIFVELINFVVI